MTYELAQAAGFILLAVLLGLGLKLVLHMAADTVRERRTASRIGVTLVVTGITAVIIAVVRFGQEITTGVLLTLVGTMACAVGAILVMESRDA